MSNKNYFIMIILRFSLYLFFPLLFIFIIMLIFLPSQASEISFLSYYQIAKLMPGDTEEGDSFGRSVAISGNTAIIGAPQDDDYGTDSGSAYVFVYDAIHQVWDQAAKLNASDATQYHSFGTSVAISGDTAFVGAPVHSPGGLVYVFERNQDGPNAWGEVRQIKGSDVSWGDYFGISMDISGDMLIVGAYAGGDYDGSAYIFERNQGGTNAWGQIAKLVPANNPAYNYFGYSVAISGEIAVGGAPGNNGVTGAAYIFERQSDQSWLEVVQLIPSDGAYQDYFGIAVDIDGEVLAVGSPANEDYGAVYIYERDLGGVNAWGENLKLQASDGMLGDTFGQDIFIDQDLIFIGAMGRREASGAIYIFGRDPDGSWDEEFLLTADESIPGDNLGNAIASDEFTLLAGALNATPGGAAYVFVTNTPPTEINLILSPNPIPEGVEAVLKGNFQDPDPDESHNIKVQWGDGSTTTITVPLETLAFTLTHTYLDDQPSNTTLDPYTLTITITDTHASSTLSQLPFVVENVAPSIIDSEDVYLQPGEYLLRWGTFIDPGTDTWTGIVDYGDGSLFLPLELIGKDFWLEYSYPYQGTYPLTITITDDDTGQDTSYFIVHVSDQLDWIYLPFMQR